MTDKDASVRTDEIPNSSPQRKMARPARQRAAGRTTLAVAASAVLLAGCWDPARDLKVGTIGYVTGFAGAVAVDEPRAALVARDALSAGGSAVDAAVAAAWTMAVTLPSAVGVGGGGMCVVHDSRSKTTEVIDFLPPPQGATAAPAGQGFVIGGRQGWPVAVPAMPRGLYAMHAKYGKLRWEAVMAPAEGIARFGEPASRALGNALAATGSGLIADPVAREVFTVGGTRLIGEGERLQQIDLAATLGRLRQQGPGTLYDGMLGNQFLDAVQQAGGHLTREQLRAYAPTWRASVRQAVGNDTLHVPPQGMVGHDLLAVWNGGAPGAGTAAQPEGGTGLVVVDGTGSAVACALTMNGPFGLGRMARGMGMMFAEAGPAEGMTRTPLAAGLMINHNVNEFRLGVGAVGSDATANAARAAQAAIPGGQPATQAVAGLRGVARTNLVSCPMGVPARPDTCTVAVDPRGAGFAAVVGVEPGR